MNLKVDKYVDRYFHLVKIEYPPPPQNPKTEQPTGLVFNSSQQECFRHLAGFLKLRFYFYLILLNFLIWI